MTSPLRIAYVGNFRPAHSTENHVARALTEDLGHRVIPWQEDDESTWRDASLCVLDGDVDFVLWTRTWHLPGNPQQVLLNVCRDNGIPTVGFHLDRWWGLNREHQIYDEPFFQVDLLATADGGHDAEWAKAGISHVWSPPAVDRLEAERVGRVNERFLASIAFVGSWAQYHIEWGWRLTLIRSLRSRYGRRMQMWPKDRVSIRGQDLTDLYTSAAVIIGDSCLVGEPERYWSDRIPETLGRGGYLIHPAVVGLEDWHPDLVTYPLFDLDALYDKIDRALAMTPQQRADAVAPARADVLARHTYTHRLHDLIEEHVRPLVVPWAKRSGPACVSDGNGHRATFDLRPDTTDGIVVEEIWRTDVYEIDPEEVKGRTIVDIGANVGAFSVWALVNGAEKVWAYEPQGDNRDALLDNLAANQVEDRCVVMRTAVGGAGVTSACIEGHSGGAYVAAWDRLTGDSVVDALPLEDVLLRAGAGLGVKIDVEGSEFVMFNGLDPGHLRRVDWLVMEFHGPRMTTPVFGEVDEWARLVRFLAEHGTIRVVGRPSVGGTLWWRRYQ